MRKLTSLLAVLTLAGLLVVPANLDAQNVSMFRIDLMQGGEGPAANWYSVSGGGYGMVFTNDWTGETTESAGTPIPEAVTLTGPLVNGGGRAELLQWLNTAMMDARGASSTVTTTLLDANQQAVRTVNFYDALPVRYVLPGLRSGDDTLLEESLVFQPTRTEDSGGSSRGASSTELEQVLTGRSFQVELDGRSISATSVHMDDLVFELEEPTIDSRTGDARFYVTGVHVGEVTLEAPYHTGSHLKSLWDATAAGQAREGYNLSVLVHDRDGNPARRYDYYQCTPVYFSSLDLDTRQAGAALQEVMRLSCARVEFG